MITQKIMIMKRLALVIVAVFSLFSCKEKNSINFDQTTYVESIDNQVTLRGSVESKRWWSWRKWAAI